MSWRPHNVCGKKVDIFFIWYILDIWTVFFRPTAILLEIVIPGIDYPV